MFREILFVLIVIVAASAYYVYKNGNPFVVTTTAIAAAAIVPAEIPSSEKEEAPIAAAVAPVSNLGIALTSGTATNELTPGKYILNGTYKIALLADHTIEVSSNGKVLQSIAPRNKNASTARLTMQEDGHLCRYEDDAPTWCNQRYNQGIQPYRLLIFNNKSYILDGNGSTMDSAMFGSSS